MLKENELNSLIKLLKDHERRISVLEGKKIGKSKPSTHEWYKPGSTIEKIVLLIHEKFFNQPRSISEIIEKLATKDYHLGASDLTLPLRKIVRKGMLSKTKKNADGSLSKKWLYLRV